MNKSPGEKGMGTKKKGPCEPLQKPTTWGSIVHFCYIYTQLYITYCMIHIYSHTYCSSWLNNGDSHDITGIDEIEWGVDGRSTMILPGMYMIDTP